MDFDDTPEEAAWRSQVRAFLEEHRAELGERSAQRGFDDEVAREREALLYDGGLVGVTWPTDAGGQGGTPMQQGSEDQKSRYLRRLLRADDVWCQLFSEPASGSDLAALRTKAVRTEDGDWRVDGQKVWTTLAHLADYGILLTRTDPDVAKHRGLTMFVVDMKAPGVTVRPLRQMSGGADFNEVFFDDVVIPDSERLGDVGDGWRVALTTLMSERMSLGGGGTEIGAGAASVVEHVAAHVGGMPEGRQALVRQQLGRSYVDALANRYTGYRLLSKISKGELPGPEASAGKLSGTKVGRDLADLAVRVLGDEAAYAATADGSHGWQDLQAVLPGMAIAGGTNEVLRNIIGERVLGLPAEPRADKGITFKESLASARA